MCVCSTKEVREVPLVSNPQPRGPLDNKYVWGLIFRQRAHLVLAGLAMTLTRCNATDSAHFRSLWL